jgi:hypothetical protein
MTALFAAAMSLRQVDEDHVVVGRLGRLVVQARQLAMVPAAP